MKKRTTRCLALLLAVVMVLSVMPVAMAEETTQTQTYTKVTKAPADWSGTYLIVSEGDKLIMDGSLDKLDVEGNKVDVTITDSKITGDYAKYAFTVEPMTGGYAIKSASGKYISGKSGSNKLNSGSTQSLNTIELTSGKVIVTSDGTTLQYNNAAKNGTRFRYYKSQNQQPISLYKIETAAKQQVETPTANVADGAEIEVGTEIKFECKTEGATIYYKTAGTEYQAYTGPISASHNETYTVKATKDGMEDSKELVVSVDVFEWVNKYVKADTIATGDQVVIYNAGNGYAVAGEMLGSYYLKPAAATVAENALTADSFDKLVWTVTKNEDGTYSFKQGTDTTLTMGTNNGKFNLNLTGDGAVKWDVETCNAENASYYMSGNGLTGQYGKVYMEYYAKYTEFSAYCTSTDRLTEKDFGMTFYKLTREKNFIGGLVPPPTPTQKVATPTASPATGEVEKGTNVTFSCATEGATILIATDGTTFNEGTEATVNEDVTFTVKATKAGMDDSDEATFTYTVRKEDGEDKLGKLTSADQLTDGSYVMIVSTGYAPLELSGKWLTVVQPTVAEDKVTKTEGAVWTLKVSGQSVTLTDKNGMAIAPSGGNSNGIQSGNYSWAWSFSAENQTFKFMGAGDDTVTLASNTSTDSTYGGFNKFKAYKNNTVASQQYPCEFTLYRVDPASADQPSGDLPKPGDKFVIYNQNAQAVLAEQNDNTDSPAINKAAATITEDGKAAIPANGAVVFTVEQNGEYLRFKSDAYGYLCANGTGNNAFYSKDFSEEGVSTEDADWLVRICSGGVGGYELESRTAKFSGHSQWLEYFSDSFKVYSMYSKTGDLDYTIYSFFFYPVADGVNVDGGLVVQPTITFPETMLPAYVGNDYEFELEIDTIYEIDNPWIEYSVKKADGTYIPGISQLQGNTDVEVLDGFTTGKGRVHITVFDSDIAKAAEAGSTMTLTFAFKDIKGNEARASYTVDILDEAVISNVKPAQGAQTGAEKRPEISAEISNAGENASVTMTVNGAEVNAAYANGKVTYTPAAAMADGKVTVTVTVKRADEKETSKTWSFTIGEATFQRYFGQLHSHTQYSDGAGSLESALAYIKALPDNANVDFVAFTDHSNYFDKSGAANPEGALYDMTKATEYSQQTWKSYKDAVAAFNTENAGSMVAIAGFEMTWSGGPGHINTFNTPGIVSRNNKTLNNKTDDAGMKAYYALLSQAEGANSISQFNHPGTTFGNFKDFNYWDPVIDSRMYMVEVGNGEGAIGAGGYYPSYEQYIMALDKGWHLAPTNNQDNHKGKWGNANDARDVILTDDFSEQGIYEAIRALRMYATEDKNLELTYTVNGLMMGSSITEIPDKLNVEVTVNDPDASDSIAKVEVVANSGKVAYTWDNAAQLRSGKLSATLDPSYSYYFIRVTQKDGDLAVTSPVWVGESLKLGISNMVCGTATPVTDEELTLTTTFFNSEDSDATIKSLTYSIGGTVIGTDKTGYTLAKSSTLDVPFKYTPTAARVFTVQVTAVVEQGNNEYTFTKTVGLDVLNADSLVYIGIDASHYNEYVSGNYKDSMGNFGNLAADHSVRTVQLNTGADLIAACSNPKYKALILTAPSRRLADAQKDPKTYSDAELKALAEFNAAGGTVILAGWSDNYENYEVIQKNPAIKHMAETQNDVLKALGSSLRISDDATYDDVRSAADGVDKWRLYFSTYNTDNFLTSGVIVDADHPYDKLYTERFSHYGGASIYAVDANGNPASTLPSTVSPVVYGHATTYSIDVDKDGKGGAGTPKYTYAENDNRLLVMATEQLAGKGLIVVSGAAFMSNFEVQAQLDNGAEKNYSNYRICENLVSYLNPVQLSTIDQIHQQPEEGFKYTVEGIVTSNASGHDKDTAFFDCIYIQDETGGINCFPVAGDFKIGDRVRVSGTTSSYQGERQLAVTKIEKIGDGTPVTPLTVTSAQVNDGSVLGRLVTLKGIVTAIEMAEGKVQTILVRDSQGKVARVFIDGYICPESEVQNLKVGCAIEATGLASYDNTFVLSDGTAMAPRIRISNRADVICTDHTHAFGAWTVTTPATCTASGAETRKCACGETETRLLPATGHTDANKDGKCDLCGQTLTPATGDTMHLTLWLSLMALTALAGVALTRQKKRRA